MQIKYFQFQSEIKRTKDFNANATAFLTDNRA